MKFPLTLDRCEKPRTKWKVNNEESSESVVLGYKQRRKTNSKAGRTDAVGMVSTGGVGDDSNEEGCGGSAVNCEQYDGSDDSGEEYDGSEEELTSDAVGIDDEEFDNNIDVNVEYGGLEDIEVQHQETSLAVVPCDEITYSDEGSIAGSDEEVAVRAPSLACRCANSTATVAAAAEQKGMAGDSKAVGVFRYHELCLPESG
nr:uncharacterized protein LOC109185271 [Ipomoea trifida]